MYLKGRDIIIHNISQSTPLQRAIFVQVTGLTEKQRDKKSSQVFENVWKYGQSPSYVIEIQYFAILLVYNTFDNKSFLSGWNGSKDNNPTEGHDVFFYLQVQKF